MVIITPISDKKKSTVPEPDTVLFGGDYRDRTGDLLQDRGTKAKKQTINHENTQDIKQQKAPPRNNPGSARSRVKINNEKIESG